MSSIREQASAVLDGIIADEINGFGGERKTFTPEGMINAGYSFNYEISLPMWQGEVKILDIISHDNQPESHIESHREEILDIIDFIAASQQKAADAIAKEHDDDEESAKEVVRIEIDFSEDKPIYSFYVPSKYDFCYHVFINGDMTLDAGQIS